VWRNRLEPAEHVGGVRRVPSHEGVEHQRVALADGLARCPGHREVPPLPVGSRSRSVREEPLLGAEAHRPVLGRRGRRTIRLDRVAKHARVHGNAIAGWSAEQPVHRLPRRLAAEVPERVVDRADRVHEQPRAPMAMQPQHPVVEELDRERVGPE
jgi:hypothetical protein